MFFLLTKFNEQKTLENLVIYSNYRQQKNLTAKKLYSFINESYRNLNDIFNFLYLKPSCLFSKLDIAKWDGITPHDLRFWKV